MFQLLPLDSNSIYILYFFGNLFISILIFSYSFSYATSKSRKILNGLGISKLLLTVGWVLILLRNVISDFISVNIAVTIIFIACCYETTAMLSFSNLKAKKNYQLQIAITSIASVIFNVAVLLEATINTRILIILMGIFAVYLPITISHFNQNKHNFFRNFYPLCYAGFEILLLIRILYIFFNPKNVFFFNPTLEGLYNISSFLLAFTGTIGFLLLIKKKQDLKIQKLLDDKNIFFSIIAHDLRGPLGSSVALSKLLIEDIKEGNHGEIREIAKVLHQSNENTYKLLDNLLGWSGAQTGMMEYSPEKITLNKLINENIELNQNAALNKNIDLLFESTEQIEVEADKKMIDTIVRNLLNNAIKFTDTNGKIAVRVQRKQQNAEISITDNGIGIPDLIKEKLFKINGKVIQRDTDNEMGNGMGLLLCSELINRHHGKIWAESEPGKGSTFKFSVPLEAFRN
ncbi:HAMP domain-containing histidine kinase [Flavobacterium sp. AC]|uniref:histidine kinase n=1 Tax=Flavobacterium azizsancarii TaxID=2961580 RepID=A0ABT4WG26_9FLAO|nr:HAMP domain-containing histidine kinase [Flavobacterium azizsancarii]